MTSSKLDGLLGHVQQRAGLAAAMGVGAAFGIAASGPGDGYGRGAGVSRNGWIV